MARHGVSIEQVATIGDLKVPKKQTIKNIGFRKN